MLSPCPYCGRPVSTEYYCDKGMEGGRSWYIHPSCDVKTPLTIDPYDNDYANPARYFDTEAECVKAWENFCKATVESFGGRVCDACRSARASHTVKAIVHKTTGFPLHVCESCYESLGRTMDEIHLNTLSE